MVTVLLWMKAAQGLYVIKDDESNEIQSFSLMQNFNTTLKNAKVPDLPIITVMSEPDDKPMKKKQFKNLILKKRQMMKQKQLESAFSNMFHDLGMDMEKISMPERLKITKKIVSGLNAEDDSETDDHGDYHKVDVEIKLEDADSVDEDALVQSDHDGVVDSDYDDSDHLDESNSGSDDSDSESDSDPDSNSESGSDSDHDLKASDGESENPSDEEANAG